ncbi:DUF2314 domain-containing protein [Mucilaginibacter sp. AW1-3]
MFLGLCILLSCQSKKTDDKNKFVVGLEKNDSTFLALKDTAQSYLNVFIDSIRIHGTNKKFRFAVKSDFVENNTHEHMWSQVNQYHNGKFEGVFIDSAYQIKNIKPGDAVVIPESAIEDWSIYDLKRNVRIGDFSEKYLRSKQPFTGN